MLKSLSQNSFVYRICLSIILSLIVNFIFSFYVTSKLQQSNFEFHIKIDYNINSSLDLYFDTGSNFNQKNKKSVKVNKGANAIKIPFTLKNGEQLKFVRLDFGENTELSKVKIDELKLLANKDVLFKLNEENISKRIGFTKNITSIEQGIGVFNLETSVKPFDPYIVLNPIYEIMIPLWKRILLLVLSWFILLFIPIYKWVRSKLELRDFKMLFVGLFISLILLKTAWLTLASILLLIYGIITFIKYKFFYYNKANYLLATFFLVPCFLLGNGQFSKLAIPITFVIFLLISTTIDFSGSLDEIKKVYTKIFIVFGSILTVYCILFFCFDGYYYNIKFSNFFLDLKTNRHHLLYWVLYDHTTFISFFILIGQIFVLNLKKEKLVSIKYFALYSILAVTSLLLLGSRFALLLGIMIMLLNYISIRILKLILIPLYILIFGFIIAFIKNIDPFRAKLWKISILKMKENLWFGFGTGNSSEILPVNLPIQKSSITTIMEINHSHNQYLSYFLENGLIGSIIIMFISLSLLFLYGKQNNKTLMLIMFATMILAIIESPFKTATPTYVICFLLSVFSYKEEVCLKNL
eukprot:TRINITY_DN207_c0_g3_i2.p1 TRINITY_DN207_c0_g3~~TRINITY_DN207_c0_g3_i2.p1  ORF type:complete len:581 (+),score=73.24 TRINITY_DN207_c0_g3_i2:1432-3174(+)